MAAPFCAVHRERVAVATCRRCGNFACEMCQDGVTGMCADCRHRHEEGVRSLEAHGRPATRAVWMTAVASLLQSVVEFGAWEAGFPPLSFELMKFVGLLRLVALVTSTLLFLRWFRLAVRMASLWGPHPGATPDEATWAFLIPLVNLVKPYTIARAMAPTDQGRPAVSQWQALSVTGIIGSVYIAEYPVPPVLCLVPALFILAAAFASQRVVKLVTASIARGTSPVS